MMNTKDTDAIASMIAAKTLHNKSDGNSTGLIRLDGLVEALADYFAADAAEPQPLGYCPECGYAASHRKSCRRYGESRYNFDRDKFIAKCQGEN